MDPIRYIYFAASYNLSLWTAPIGIDMAGHDLCYGIWWVAAITYFIVRKFRPKPLYGIIDVEFKEIRR